MPESGPPDGPAMDALLSGLDDAVGRLIEAFAEIRDRATNAEQAYDKLSGALRSGEAGTGPEVEAGLDRLMAENERLKAVIDEARSRAARIRSQLIVVEDEL